jgi:hypothetical protein
MTVALKQFAVWCEALPVSMAIRDSLWAFAVIEGVHLLGLAFIGGAVLAVDLHLLGLPLGDRSARALAADIEPWFVGSLIVMLSTGIALFLSEALKCYNSTPFWWKIGSLFLAILFTFTIRRAFLRHAEITSSTAGARAVAIVSLCLWFTVGAAGRWIGFSAG